MKSPKREPLVINVQPAAPILNITTPLPPLNAREEIWVKAWVHVAAASNSTNVNTATNWADVCLADFDKRFPKHKEAQ